jgi:thiamine biosynthesis lipoprotein
MSDVATRRVEHIMGMPISLALRGPGSTGASADQAWQRVQDQLREADRVFSTYRAESVISRLRAGTLDLGACPPEVHEVLDLAERARLESHGAFNVRRPGPGGALELDPSGIVKGWAVARAAAILEQLEATDFCLSAGGDMVCRTRSADSPPWQIGVENPLSPDLILAVIPISNGAVATSGLAHRGAHITDPRTGQVLSDLASVTVVAPDLIWADIDATAAFVLGTTARDWLESRERSGVIVARSGTVTAFGGDRRLVTGSGPRT